jgi:hypothetical protein
MQRLDLSDAALIKELADNDRYRFSPRIQTLRAILAKLRPEPAREPLPPPPVRGEPHRRRASRRRGGQATAEVTLLQGTTFKKVMEKLD